MYTYTRRVAHNLNLKAYSWLPQSQFYTKVVFYQLTKLLLPLLRNRCVSVSNNDEQMNKIPVSMKAIRKRKVQA